MRSLLAALVGVVLLTAAYALAAALVPYVGAALVIVAVGEVAARIAGQLGAERRALAWDEYEREMARRAWLLEAQLGTRVRFLDRGQE